MGFYFVVVFVIWSNVFSSWKKRRSANERERERERGINSWTFLIHFFPSNFNVFFNPLLSCLYRKFLVLTEKKTWPKKNCMIKMKGKNCFPGKSENITWTKKTIQVNSARSLSSSSSSGENKLPCCCCTVAFFSMGYFWSLIFH